ncbi:MAG: DUF4838 domain-containing protein [Candidatus Omnitrophota bacterium]
MMVVKGLGRFVPAILLAAVAFCGRAESCDLVQNGKAVSCIVLPDNAGPTEKHAAEELAVFLEKVAGAKVAIGNIPSENYHTVYLGTTEAKNIPRSRAVEKAVSELEDDGFVLAADKNAVYIISRRPVGVLYGVYEILKKYAGIRWFAPGADFEYCPKNPTVIVPEQVTVSNPSFKVRDFAFVTVSWNSKTTDSWDWMVRNGMTVTFSKERYNADAGLRDEVDKRGVKIGRDGGHSFSSLLSDSLFDAHPEYFGLFDGQRRKQDGQLRQPCTSNPKVVEIMAESLKKVLATPPAGGIYLIGNNDSTAWCQCENCAKLDPPEEKQKKFVSTRYWTLVNQIAAEVYKTHPGANLWAWGYQNFQHPPAGVVPDPRLSVQVCPHGLCYRHPISDLTCVVNDKFRDILGQWGKLKNTVSTLEYTDGGCLPLYVPIEKTIAENIKYYKKIGLIGVTFFAVPPDGTVSQDRRSPRYQEEMPTQWQWYYIAAQLLWNSDVDYATIYEDIGSKYYGAAWPVMSRYRALLTKAFVETSGHVGYLIPEYFLGKCLEKPGVEADLLRMLDEAEKSAGADPVAVKRVQRDRHFFQAYWQPLHKDFLSKQQKELNANKKVGAIAMDGKLDDPDWKNADFTSDFIEMDGKTAAVPQTFVKMLCDQENLYFGVEAMEPEPGKMRIKTEKRDGAVWEDSSLEFFIISPGMDAMADTRGKYAHIIVNPKGVVYDSLSISGGNADINFDSRAEIKTTVLNDRWAAEIRIPATALLSKLQDGETWKVNVARNRRLVDGTSQNSSWSNGVFHGAEAFRSVVMGRAALLPNGDFEDLEKFSEMPGYRIRGFTETKWKFTGDSFPRVWGVHQYAGEVEVVDGGAASGRKFLRIKSFTDAKGAPASAVIAQQRLPIKEAGTLILRAKLRGKGEFTPYVWRYDRETGAPMPDFAANIGKPLKVDSKEWVIFEGAVDFDGKSYFSLALYFTSAEGIDIDDLTITRGNRWMVRGG